MRIYTYVYTYKHVYVCMFLAGECEAVAPIGEEIVPRDFLCPITAELLKVFINVFTFISMYYLCTYMDVNVCTLCLYDQLYI
jgi:hypothetical protein